MCAAIHPLRSAPDVTSPIAVLVRACPPARRLARAALPLALLACLGAAPAVPPAGGAADPPASLDALAGRPSNRFT